MNKKGCERQRLWPGLLWCSRICLEALTAKYKMICSRKSSLWATILTTIPKQGTNVTHLIGMKEGITPSTCKIPGSVYSYSTISLHYISKYQIALTHKSHVAWHINYGVVTAILRRHREVLHSVLVTEISITFINLGQIMVCLESEQDHFLQNWHL